MPSPRNGSGMGAVRISIRPMGRTLKDIGGGVGAVRQPPSFKIPDENWVYSTYSQGVTTGYIKPYSTYAETYAEAQTHGHIQTYAEAIRTGNIRTYRMALDNSTR